MVDGGMYVGKITCIIFIMITNEILNFKKSLSGGMVDETLSSLIYNIV